MALPETTRAWSVWERTRQRMLIHVLRQKLGKEVRDQDELLKGLPPETVKKAMEVMAERWQRIAELEDDLTASRPFPDGDSCCIARDEPVFGEGNPPDSDEFLYHYTPTKTLPKIRKSMSLRFSPLHAMNDPHEALATHAFQTGLMGPSHEELVMTRQDAKRFGSIDWVAEVNAVRANVKVGAFTTDTVPDLTDIDLEFAGEDAPRRYWASRGFAHPRMWAQYADKGAGVCLVLNYEQLRAAVAASVDRRFAWGHGEVTYRPLDHDLNLGFFDDRDLLRDGASQALLRNFKESLLTKHGDWAHEDELRFFVMDGTDQPWFVPIGVGVIVGLVLGPQLHDRHLRNVRAFAHSFGISGRVRRLAWTHGRPELIRGPL
jgi:hypothetical protein